MTAEMEAADGLLIIPGLPADGRRHVRTPVPYMSLCHAPSSTKIQKTS